jgi:hypothetical protein
MGHARPLKSILLDVMTGAILDGTVSHPTRESVPSDVRGNVVAGYVTVFYKGTSLINKHPPPCTTIGP